MMLANNPEEYGLAIVGPVGPLRFPMLSALQSRLKRHQLWVVEDWGTVDIYIYTYILIASININTVLFKIKIKNISIWSIWFLCSVCLQHEPMDQQSLEAQVQFVHQWFNCLARSSIKSEGHNLSSRLLAADPTGPFSSTVLCFHSIKEKKHPLIWKCQPFIPSHVMKRFTSLTPANTASVDFLFPPYCFGDCQWRLGSAGPRTASVFRYF